MFQTGYIASEMTEFSEKCMSMATDVYCSVSSLESIIHDESLKTIIQVSNNDQILYYSKSCRLIPFLYGYIEVYKKFNIKKIKVCI